MNHICLIRLVVLKRPGFQSRKYGMPITRASFCYNKIVRNMHLFLTKVAFMHKDFKRQWFTQAIYLHIMLNISKHWLSGEKWRSFANSLRSMLKLRSTEHEVAWQFNHLAYSSGLMFVWPGHFYNCFQVIIQFESVITENRTILK